MYPQGEEPKVNYLSAHLELILIGNMVAPFFFYELQDEYVFLSHADRPTNATFIGNPEARAGRTHYRIYFCFWMN